MSNTKTFMAALITSCLLVSGGYMLTMYLTHRNLVRNGCQEYFSAATGKIYMAGKAMLQEYVYIYECDDGKRTELRRE